MTGLYNFYAYFELWRHEHRFHSYKYVEARKLGLEARYTYTNGFWLVTVFWYFQIDKSHYAAMYRVALMNLETNLASGCKAF
jgi:hypothetical protein